MSYVHVVTVGVALAINYERERMGQRVPEGEAEERLRKMNDAERTQYRRRLLKYIFEKEEEGRVTEASAELNALSRFLSETSMVYLIHTDTNLGRCCAWALKEYLIRKGVQVPEPIEIQGLHGPETFQRGLADLAKTIAKIVVQHKNVRICATGGFKPEVAVASIIGFIAQKPVYYIHEAFREEVHLPPFPIEWKYEVRKHGEAIETILKAGSTGVEKEAFREMFGLETSNTLLNNWLVEEKQGRYRATEIYLAILEAIQILQKSRG